MTADRYVRPLALGVALLANADDLIDDAQLLLDAARPARALVLSVCAAEEMAKISFCLDALTTGSAIPASSSREWRDHKEKVLSTLALDAAFVHPRPDLAVKQVRSDAEALSQARMAGLYVDHDAEEIRIPSGGGFDIASLLERLRANSHHLHTIFDHATPELFAEMAPHLPKLAAELERHLDENDLTGTLQVLRGVVATTSSGLRGTSATASR